MEEAQPQENLFNPISPTNERFLIFQIFILKK